MGWMIDVFQIGIGSTLGVIVGALVTKRRTRRAELLDCYTNYFADVVTVALKADATTADAALFLVSRASHRLEFLESDRTCLMAIGMLFAKCNVLVAALTSKVPAARADVMRLRTDISEEYASALMTVRQRLGFGWNPLPPDIAAPSSVQRSS